MIQHKHTYLILGFIIGYIIGSTSFITMLIILLIIGGGIWSKGERFKIFFLRIKEIYPKRLEYKVNEKTVKLNAMINNEILTEINEYCKWQQKTPASFIENAAAIIFARDKDWIAYQRKIKKNNLQNRKSIKNNSTTPQ